ncbi:MAG: AmmeMemoRadiSam system radical SAM enzyme [Magnetococcales bacterium]|nr:AmmeMemoRadiSam system radical SAM enzyme [Magnetococcales bacterium]NGZ27997.1 AmmeMemoRadiSam system radical SAM enzyme [Magnetococcales bacterium]
MEARYWHLLNDGRLCCEVCPRECRLAEGQRGVCFVRTRQEGRLILETYGRSTGFCLDPIEKKPLNHFLPGTATLSFGTAGCNLTCKFCQNWHMSKSRQVDDLAVQATPEAIARAARHFSCGSVSFTYNDPVIFLEYAVDTAIACHQQGVKTVAVTAGYIQGAAREEFFRHMDAANVDLKAFSDAFYRRLVGGHRQVVLETLEYLAKETKVWLEITTLLIPGENDSIQELEDQCRWMVDHLGEGVPIHFTAFHPDWRMLDKPRTSLAILNRAMEIAGKNGVRYAYTGNVADPRGGSTWCPGCGKLTIGRTGWNITAWHLNEKGACQHCGMVCPGVFAAKPGTWGSKRIPVRMG